ncbi:MAG TPA: hypothetical protein DIT25_04600 [Candidatus Moranbacteria bacterium]|nr:hypothetical protein [Candidatus Moranbacteria bacterium]
MPEFFEKYPGSEMEEEKFKKNIYGNEKFPPEKAKEHLDALLAGFKEHFFSLGYHEETPVLITSGIDSSVRFIGSHISVFKPYLIQERIPNPGIFMRQNCLRTRNADKLLEDSFALGWGSYFTSLGAIAPAERLKETCVDTFNFFKKQLNISPENILIRINSSDDDLVEACRENLNDENLEFDKEKEEYYKHKIGVEGISGRSFNIALRNSDGKGFADVGNIILLSNNKKILGVELALGSSTILKELYGLDHVLDCSPVIGLENIDNNLRRKFEDAIITSVVLFNEGLRPFGKHNRNRILKQYLKALAYFKMKSGIDFEKLSEIITGFEKREFPDSEDRLSGLIIEIIKTYET